MTIYSMTATFGKLEHETLTLKQGLNIIEAPNEWGKSTWCAFLTAMLYGIDTRTHAVTKNALADKARYDPWSGSLMSGRVELCWQGKDITIERSSTKRAVMKEFRAYETATGVPIPQLTGDNCGQMLLGVERSVFTRSAFVRLADMPVTEDDALRRRLNDLVTTGDESGAADALARRLNELKNTCRANRSKGLLPQAEARRDALEKTLRELGALQGQAESLTARRGQLEERQKQLQNHRAALEYAHAGEDRSRIAAAQAAAEEARAAVRHLEAQCAGLPDAETARLRLRELSELHSSAMALEMEAQMLPHAAQPPQTPAPFLGLDPEQAADRAKADGELWHSLTAQAKKQPFPLWLLAVLAALGGGGLLAAELWPGYILLGAAVAGIAAYTALAVSHNKKKGSLTRRAEALAQSYGSHDPADWTALAQDYAAQTREYRNLAQREQAARGDLDSRRQTLVQKLRECAGDRSLSDAMAYWEQTAALWDAHGDALREETRAASLAQTLRAMAKTAQPPAFPDHLTYTAQETDRLLSDCAQDLRQLQHKLGLCQGQMEALGREETLRRELWEVKQRIGALEDTYAALTLAQETLTEATAQLQRRFAPRISRQAQAYFARLTGGRYDRLTLGEDLSLHASARDEDTLRAALWRSEGTVDQLYLALRLAVAKELTPQAPLILDDALVRFDDTRLKAAMEILREEAATRQVILFTCQSREAQA